MNVLLDGLEQNLGDFGLQTFHLKNFVFGVRSDLNYGYWTSFPWPVFVLMWTLTTNEMADLLEMLERISSRGFYHNNISASAFLHLLELNLNQSQCIQGIFGL